MLKGLDTRIHQNIENTAKIILEKAGHTVFVFGMHSIFNGAVISNMSVNLNFLCQ